MYHDIRQVGPDELAALAGASLDRLALPHRRKPDVERFLAYSRIFHDAHRYTNDGPVAKMLESRLAHFHEVAHCIVHANAFWALVLTIKALALPGRRRVVMPAVSEARLVDAVSWCGLVPSFCEVDGLTLAMGAELTASCLDDDTALILGVHLPGRCSDAPALAQLAEARGLPLVFDSVDAAHSRLAGRKLGGLGDAQCFSLHPNSSINGFEGGYVTTDDADLARRLAKIRAFGFYGQDNIEHLGINAKLNEIHAAMALASLDAQEPPAMRRADRPPALPPAAAMLPTPVATDGPALAGHFALFGAPPVLAQALPVGQLFFPAWDRYEAAMRAVCEEGRYTDHGPLVQRLEARLAQRMRVRHAICVSNATLGLMMACEALGLRGKVILPSFTFIATPQALSWCGLTPVFCDVDPATHHVSAELIEPLIDRDVSAILAVNLWGDACPAGPLQALADRRGLSLFFDSAHSMGCEIDGVPVGNFGALEVFSFHATKAFSSAEGGCITTNDDALAARLRSIRGRPGAPGVAVRSAEAGMSEAQAAIGLLNLDDFDATIARNEASFEHYRRGLAGVPGLTLCEPRHASKTNRQYVVCAFDEAAFGMSRESLLAVLKAENIIARRYFFPGSHRSTPYAESLPQFVEALPETDRLNARLLQLPTGALVSDEAIAQICERIATAQAHATEIEASLRRA